MKEILKSFIHGFCYEKYANIYYNTNQATQAASKTGRYPIFRNRIH